MLGANICRRSGVSSVKKLINYNIWSVYYYILFYINHSQCQIVIRSTYKFLLSFEYVEKY